MRPCLTAVATACAIIFIGGPVACDRSATRSTPQMTTEQLIRQNVNAPVGQTITPITLSLASKSIFVATDDTTTTQPTTVKLQRLRFKTAKDNQGRTWAYAYTNRVEFARAFPQGSGYTELSFREFFVVIERDPEFAGIFLNAGSDAAYPIQRELFQNVKAALSQTAAR